MKIKQWYEKLFENYAQQYEKESFTKGTKGECDFIEKEISFKKDIKILDVGCGTGRHLIELSKRGYKNLTGVDLSENQLALARKKAEDQNVEIKFSCADARNLPFTSEFDLVLMLCEGGFPLMETDEMNYEILKNVKKSIRTGGKVIFTTLNGLFPVHNSIENFVNSENSNGNAEHGNLNFDLMNFRDTSEIQFTDDDGTEHKLMTSERWYIPSEITWLLKSVGFNKIEIFGARLGEFSREHKLTINDFEMLVIAE